jgi:hypothetical protein
LKTKEAYVAQIASESRRDRDRRSFCANCPGLDDFLFDVGHSIFCLCRLADAKCSLGGHLADLQRHGREGKIGSAHKKKFKKLILL